MIVIDCKNYEDNRITFHIRYEAQYAIIMTICVICQQAAGIDQPMFCEHCNLYIAQIHNDVYLGNFKISCHNCQAPISGVDTSCGACGKEATLHNYGIISEDTPHPRDIVLDDKLTMSVMSDEMMAKQMFELMGIETLTTEEQASVLSKIGLDKMHPLSTEYDFKEAQTILELAVRLAQKSHSKWVEQLAIFRLAKLRIRQGRLTEIQSLLFDMYQGFSEETIIDRLRRTEILANFALLNRLAGNIVIADQAIYRCNNNLQSIFREILVELKSYDPEKDSDFPRVDMVADIISVLADEAIIQGPHDKLAVPDVALDKLLQLDNMLDILAQITDKNTPMLFYPQLQEYIRLINGLFWYGEVLLQNNAPKRQVLLENSYIRVMQWLEFVPVENWIRLKLSRLIEAYTRADDWSERIDANQLKRDLLAACNKDYLPHMHFMIAQAEKNVGKLDLALGNIQKILQLGNLVEDTLRALSERMQWNLQLESIGILTGVKSIESKIKFPVTIQLNEVSSVTEPETYLRERFKSPILRLSFDPNQPIVESGIAIFGEILSEMIEFQEEITHVGDHKYDDPIWSTPADKEGIIVKGNRLDILILSGIIREDIVHLLFEGKKQSKRTVDDTTYLDSPSLLVLKGIISHNSVEEQEVIQMLIDLMAKNTDVEPMIGYTLKK